ncbi:diguanylate cyclase [Massilia sp. TN1-12]|uniref:diguanylate cyclase n=1 Tax=Massilia paldalensis TaxID=3377675 RepID=UPI00384B1D91
MRFVDLVFGLDPRMRRMLRYWVATACLYAFFALLMLLYSTTGLVSRDSLLPLAAYTVATVVVSYALIRGSARLGLAPTTLATLQGLLGIGCNVWAYSIAGPLRGATLMGLMVVVVFCTFALGPGQTLRLAVVGLAGLGATMYWHQAHDPWHYPPEVEAVTFAIMAACSLAVTFLTGEMSKLRARLTHQKAELEKALGTIRTLATVDDLTGLANRRHMNEALGREQRRAPGGRPTCVALLDIDHFKRINDLHGHAAGDAVLRLFARTARARLRDTDMLARWGGEEFLLMLPDTDPIDAAALLERMRADVAAVTLPDIDPTLRITFSAGLATRRGSEALTDTVNRADKVLYQAKAAGRNRVVAA